MTQISEDQQDQILEFVSEITEMLDSVEPTLINLGSTDDSEEIKSTVNDIFRLFHSMKGGAGFLQLSTIEKITHSAENLLQHFRKDPTTWHSDYLEVLMNSCDVIRQMLEQAKEEFHDTGFEEEATDLIAQLAKKLKLLTGDSGADSMSAAPKPNVEPAPTPAEVVAEASPLFDLPDLTAPAAEPEKKEETPQAPASTKGLGSFVSSAEELLETAEGAILVLERLGGEVDNQEYLHSILRSFHTIKGNAGFLGLALIERLSHKAETVLEEMKEGKLTLDEQSTQVILEVIDVLREGTVALAQGLQCDATRFEETETKLIAFSANPTLLGNIMVEMGTVKPDDVEEALDQQKSSLGNILVKMGKANPQDVEKALETQNTRQKKTPAAKPSSIKAQDIRVGLDKLDKLIDLVGELVISETMIAHHPALESNELEDLRNMIRQLDRYIRELQETAMSMRMVPVSSVFQKMVRVVHDTSKKLGKQVDLKMVGEKTEVDKTLVEQVADPLLHLIRNAVDHGVEMPGDRKAAGKSSNGTIRLEAQHVGNEVWIIIDDDGKGLSRDVILGKAKEKGMVGDDGESLADEDVWKLILEPGFSTKEAVTDLSGRGVGMDVVKQNIEKLRGSISIESKLGSGSIFTLKIPLTLTIIDGLLIRVANTSYALPTTTIKETLQPQDSQVTKTMDGTEMLRLREKMLPILRLHTLYHLDTKITELSKGMILVIEQSDQMFCIFVDSVLGQQQIVVKGLPQAMVNVPHLSGCTILGNGQVGLILDASSLSKITTQPRARG
ncbi:MAG: chemotaxis protein CheA [SAR324 cluster bacterium]|nr:chemotaxis protein CheA [SAR324 cluster bacterium]